MPKSMRYFLSTNNNYAYLDLDYIDATLQGSEIVLTGSSAVDDVVVGKGFKLDFSASANGADNIYIRGALTDFNYAKLDNAQTLVLLANNTRIKLNSADNIIFNDGRISVANLIQQVSSSDEAAPVTVSAISNQQGWQAGVNSAPSQTLTSAALTAYATDTAVVFAPSNKSQTLRGGSGLDTVYVAAGSQVDATDLADAEDIIYLSKASSTYTATVTGNILQLVDGAERVRVIKGDRLLFSNGGVSVADAILAVQANAWNSLALTLDNDAPRTLSTSFKDTGSSTSDRITSDNRIALSGFEYGASWQYQIDGGTWVNGSGNQLLASVGSHRYQVRQVDRAGNTSGASDLGTLEYRAKALGFVMNGPNASGNAGKIVSRAGDVNGDGLADIAIAEPNSAYTIVNGAWSSSDSTRAGTGYVVFGKTSNTAIELSSLHSSNGGGFALRFGNFDYTAAFDISNAGDVNGDGLDDIIMGVQKDRSANMGYACVVFGKTNDTAIELSNIANGNGGFVIKSQSESQHSLYKVSAAGDVNGDGYGDLLMANIADVASRVGFAYVVFGKSTGTPVDPAGIASGSSSQGFVIHAESATNTKISSLTSIGDINGDGLADLMIGLPSASTGERCYVVYGKSSPTAVELSAIAQGNGGFVLEGISSKSERFGFSISDAGDVNGDGLMDLILGASTGDTETKANIGFSYVVFGVAHPVNINMSDITKGTGGFVILGESAGDQSGFSVSAAGDVNGDGLADMIVGAPYADPSAITDAGRGYVVFGKNNSSAVYLSDIANGNGGFAIYGQSSGDQAGYSVSAAGDINGDGLADLIVGAPFNDYSGLSNPGRAYVIFGKTDTAPVNLSDVAANYGNTPFSVNHLLDATDNTWVGTSGNESAVAGAGNDTLTGNGGVDVLYGGAGNDVFVLNASNIDALSGAAAFNKDDVAGILYQLARVDGGSGIDTLRVSGGANLDLTSIKNVAAGALDGGSRISSIEKIDLATDSSANTLKLALNDVVDMAGMNLFNAGNGWNNVTGTEFAAAVNKHQLVVQGTALLDAVDIDTDLWTKVANSSVRNANVIYDIWNHNTSYAQLLVQQGVQVM